MLKSEVCYAKRLIPVKIGQPWYLSGNCLFQKIKQTTKVQPLRISYRFIEIVNETMPLPEGQSEHFEYKKLIVKNCTAAGSGERENAFHRFVKV